MDSVYILISSLFFFWIIRNIFYWVGIWQNSDFNISLFINNFKNEISKRDIYEHLFLLYKLFLFGLFYYVVVTDYFLIYSQILISLAYFIQFLIVIKEIYKNEFKKPALDFRSSIIITFSLLNSFLLYSVPLIDKFFWLLIIDLTLVFFIGFFVFIISFPIEIYVDIQTEKAVRKIKNNKNLRTIIVLGNYGVNETKKIITHVLRGEHKVLQLQESESTVLGIANAVSKKLTNDIDYLITQVKANNQDEIKLIYQILLPKIIVITGIGSNKLLATQLINILPKDGIVLFNGREKNAYWLYQTTRKNKAIYNYLTIPANITINTGNHLSIIAYNIIKKKDGISFDVSMNSNSMHLIINEIKEHKIEYILPAIFLANHLGIKKADIKKSLSTVK